MNIINYLQEVVNQIAKEEFKNDVCPPTFTVSLIQRYDEYGKINNHEIGLTINHLGKNFTRTIFPLVFQHFDYPDLKEEMRYLYNNTI